MKTRPAPLLLLATLALSSPAAFAQSAEQEERIGASFVLALGRAPAAGEIESWQKLGRIPVADLIARHGQQLQSDADVRRATVARACADAFDREPAASEFDAWSRGNRNYTELMQQHVQWLADHPADYRQVIERAYRFVMRRPTYSVEVDYWNARPALTYALLIGCIEDWARRNAPGLMATTGIATVSVNCDHLTTIRLSPAIATEARAAAGFAPAGNADAAAAAGRNLIAAGGGSVATGGRIHFVAAGGDSIRASR